MTKIRIYRTSYFYVDLEITDEQAKALDVAETGEDTLDELINLGEEKGFELSDIEYDYETKED